jgi:hypothetical protein
MINSLNCCVKRFYAFLILFVMLFNAAGFYLYYVVKLQQIRSEMRQALKFTPENELDVLKMTVAQFLNAKADDHEVKFNGRMYDIARIITTADSVTVYGKHDEREDNLIALLDYVITAPMKGKDLSRSAATTLIVLTFIAPVGLSLVIPQRNWSPLPSRYLFITKTFKPLLDTLPPWSCLSC